MEAFLNLPKKGDKIYTIERCKIETYFVQSLKFHRKPDFEASKDLSQDIDVELERYNDGVNFYQTTKRLSDCFLTKEELINQL
jgi:hypothetical protein